MRLKRLGTFIISTPLYLYASLSWGSISNDLNGFFNRLEPATNISAPHAYAGQQAGYYTGGSLFTRFKTRNTPIVNLQLPQMRAGCGGIDLYTGGFSYINSGQMIALLQNIISNASGYAFELALEHTYPLIGNIAEKMQWLAQNVNQTNLNSCQMAESLVGGTWQTVRQSQQQLCEDIGQNQGYFSDWTAAREACSTGGQFNNMMDAAQTDPRYQNLVIYNRNLVWQILQQHSFLKNDPELAQLFMSLSGTLIIRDYQGNDDPVYTLLEPLASDENLIHALLYGGEAQIYQCENNQICLWPEKRATEITALSSIVGQIHLILQSMVDKIKTDTPLNDQEIALLETSALPLYKILTVESVFYSSVDTIDNLAEVLAVDWVLQYLQEMTTFVQARIQDSQYPSQIIDKLQPFQQMVREQLAGLRTKAYSRLAMKNQVIAQTNTLEQMLVGELSSDLASQLQWSGEMG